MERAKFVPIKYELIACHVDMGFEWVNKEQLVEHFEELGVPYIIAGPGEAQKKKDGEPFGCFWCSWTRRKRCSQLRRRQDAPSSPSVTTWTT